MSHGARRAAYPDFGQRTLAPIHYESANKRRLSRPIRARAEQADKLAKEILELSDKIEDDNPVKVQRARLQVDSRKWLAARLAPKKYGDQVQHEHKGGVNFQPQILIQCSSGENEGYEELYVASEAASGAPQQGNGNLVRRR